MRLRRKPWARPELEACPFYISHPETYRGKWSGLFEENYPLHVELGCGKGGFIAQKVVTTPKINYLAIDIKDEVLVLAKRKIEQAFAAVHKQPQNIYLMAQDIERIDTIFSKEDTVERIYINFCNPWPKAKHKKRRLTHSRQLVKYNQFLKVGGEIWFRTDDDELFEESLEYFAQCGYTIKYLTRDFQNADFADKITTEHEQMFLEAHKTIKFLVAVLEEPILQFEK